MPELPSSPISPREFMEEFLPLAMVTSELSASADAVEIDLGVLLSGEGGGEWVISLAPGAASVEQGPREGAALTLIQSVDDWRGALWEGRGGAFGEQAAAIFRQDGRFASAFVSVATSRHSDVLGQLAELDGVVEVVVTDGPGGDWSTAFKLGPGAIPEEPTTRVTVTAEDADAMRNGSLDLTQAFMSGRIQIAGDATLVLQVAALQATRS